MQEIEQFIETLNMHSAFRVRFDEINSGNRALLLCLDFSKTPSPERRELFGEDCDLFDLFFEPERIWNFALAHGCRFSHKNKSVQTKNIPGFDSRNYFPLFLISFEGGELINVPVSLPDIFRKERYNDDPVAYTSALRRIGLAIPQGSNYTRREKCEYKIQLPRFHSLAELEKEIRKVKFVLWLHGNQPLIDRNHITDLPGADTPEYVLDRIDWFDYEGIINAFDADFMLRGAALGIADILVNLYGCEWQLENDKTFITHVKLSEPIPVECILSDYACPPVPEFADPDNYHPDLNQRCRHAIKTIVEKICSALHKKDVLEATHDPV